MKEKNECIDVLKNLCGYVDNDLSGKCCEEIEKHLRECESCRSEFENMEEVLNLCRKSRESLTKEEKKRIMENVFNRIEKE